MTPRTLSWARDVWSALGDLVRGHDLGDRGGAAWRGATVDSRADCAGCLFFALKGESTDGHRYVEAAFAAGSVAAVIEDPGMSATLSAAGIPYVLVTDSRRALQELARAHRDRLQVRVVAITGSSGKTTTKEYVRAILRAKFRVHANPGNYNSLVGVPLTVLQADEDIEYLVCEVGANQPGEIAFLSGLLRPDIGVITNVGDAHVGFFGSRRGIAQAKSELFDAMGSTTRAVLPRDDDFFDVMRARVKGKLATFGQSADADFRMTDVENTIDGVRFAVNGESMRLPVLGAYNAENATAAFAVADVCGVEPERTREALAAAVPMVGRGRLHRARGAVLIDESYNASPASMARSLAMLAGLPAPRRVAVLGDMLELGDHATESHRATARRIAALAIDEVCWVGEFGAVVGKELDAAGAGAAFHPFENVDALLASGGPDIGRDVVVLVKGSRGCKLDRFVGRWLSEAGEEEGGTR